MKIVKKVLLLMIIFTLSTANVYASSTFSATASISETVSPFASFFNITFSDTVDSGSLKGNIYIEDLSGSKADVYCTASENTVKVNYGQLKDNTDYKLVITSGVKSVNDIQVTEKTYTFKTTASVLIDIDFNDARYTVGGKPPTDEGLRYQSNGTWDDTSAFVIKQTAGGRKYLNGGSTTKSKDTQVRFVFPEAIEPSNETVFIETGYFVDKASNGINRNVGLVSHNLGTDQVAWTSETDVKGKGSFFASAQSCDGDGFMNLRYGIYTQGNELYFELDNTNDATAPVKWQKSGMNKVNTTYQVAHTYPTADTALTDTFSISRFKVYKAVKPKVLYADINGIDISDDIVVCFDSDMNETAEVTLSNLPVSCKWENKRKLIITPKDYLNFGGSYNLSVSDTENTAGMSCDSFSGTVTVNTNGITVSDCKVESGKLKFNVTNEAEDDTVIVAFALIIKDKKIISCEEPVTINSDGQQEIRLTASTSDCDVRLMLFNTKNSSFLPMYQIKNIE